MSENRIPAKLRALGLWSRYWQLTGGVWPPPSRAMAYQLMTMLKNMLLDASRHTLLPEDAMAMAREALEPLLAQRFYPGSEQDIAIDRLTEVILDAEIGEFLE